MQICSFSADFLGKNIRVNFIVKYNPPYHLLASTHIPDPLNSVKISCWSLPIHSLEQPTRAAFLVFPDPPPEYPFLAGKIVIIISMKTTPAWSRCLAISMFLLMLMPKVECFCASSKTFPHSTCTFEYGFNDSNCSIFAFSKCSWSACTKWSGQPQNSFCQHHQNRSSTNWQVCTSSCCSSTKSYPYQLSSLQECQTDIQQSTTIPMIIFVSSIIGGCLLIFSLILFCCCKERIYEKCNSIKGCCQALSGFFFACVTCRCYARAQPQKLQKYSQKSDCSIESSWSINRDDLNEKLKDVCSVCLEINPTLELQCRHVFHRQCIVACMAMKKECVMCRSKEFDKIKVYCEVCLSAYFQTTLLKHMKALADLKQVCSGCKQTQERRSEVTS